MSKLFLNRSIKFVPQMDLSITANENGGAEGNQTFLVRKTDLDAPGGNLAVFGRSSRWEQLYPEVPRIWSYLTIKTVGEGKHHSPGVYAVTVTFTGYLLPSGSGNGSSGEEPSVPTSNLRGNLEEMPLVDSRAWKALSDESKRRLGWLTTLPETVNFNIVTSEYGKMSDGEFTAFPTGPGVWVVPTGDELIFARMIAQGKNTYKGPSWNYNYRTESKTGFTAAQLNKLGKIIETPLGDPVRPSDEWTWLLVGPDQTQSGPERFTKDLSYQLIPNNPENQMLYGT